MKSVKNKKLWNQVIDPTWDQVWFQANYQVTYQVRHQVQYPIFDAKEEVCIMVYHEIS